MAGVVWEKTTLSESYQRIAYASTVYDGYTMYHYLYAKYTPNPQAMSAVVSYYVNVRASSGSWYNKDKRSLSISFGGANDNLDFIEGNFGSGEKLIVGERTLNVKYTDAGTLTSTISWTSYVFSDYFSSSATLSLPSIASIPTITMAEISRCDINGVTDNYGKFAKIRIKAETLTGVISSVVVTGDASGTGTGTGYPTIDTTIIVGGSFLETSQYEFTASVSNNTSGIINTIAISLLLSTSAIPRDFYDDGEGNVGVAFGGYARAGHIDNFLQLGIGFNKYVTIYETDTMGISQYTINNIDDYDFIILCCALGGNDIQCQIVPAIMFKNGRVVAYISAVSTSQVRYLFARLSNDGSIDASNKGDSTGGIRYIYGITRK